MSTLTTKNDSPELYRDQASCSTGTCSTGVSSPCLIFWGVALVYFVVTALLNSFQ